MNNQNRPKANYHLLATVATLGPVRGGTAHKVSGGVERCETLQGGDNSLYLPLIVLLTIIAYF